MPKPIAFNFGKVKNAPSLSTSISTSVSLPTKKPSANGAPNSARHRTALHADDNDQDEEEPKYEAVTGFSTSGAILIQPIEEKKDLVIENSGNQDWRTRGRGKDLLPKEVRAAKEGQDVVMVETDKVSTASGLQFASKAEINASTPTPSSSITVNNQTEPKPKSVDEEALAALLSDNPNAPRSNTVIESSTNRALRPHEETEDFRIDVASRPNSSTLEEYAAMPVEEFGLAMLRGMGKKRRANGEVINLEPPSEKKDVKSRKQEGFLGIGAKPAPGMDGVELGAWGKADMRKNNKGQGFFTPLMVKDIKTGEVVTEEEMERRKKDAVDGDWRERRNRNLEKHGRDRDGDDNKEAVNGFPRRERDDDSGHESSRSRRDKDRNTDYDSSKSKRRRSRSRSRDRRYRDDDEKYESSSSRRHKDHGHGRDRDRDRSGYRERHKDRDYDRDDRRHRDRDRR
ncbi:DNA primase large subunit Spp2 [Neophaeococcomyces mojaviensis]|uniref:DNA primase large subunit Spp2 n=1 Tax=Neophaeococcomyces mojaviensis TaxID=3383035 RepID=A0ACC3A5Q9_9EURO|nr:DNA primase large subunit Spp2 [Knufia sp. JES_112]